MSTGQKINVNNQDKSRQDRYETEVEGVSMKTLETGLWWAKNRLALKRVLIIFLIIFSAASLGYAFFGLGSYLFFGMNEDALMVKKLVQNTTAGQDYILRTAAKNLIYLSTGTISNNGKYDLYMRVKNPNPKHWGSFYYCFTTASGEKSCGNDFILPGEEKYILSLAKNFKSPPSSLAFAIDDIVWHKINNRIIPDWNKYQNDRLNISVKNKMFIPASGNEISEKIDLNTLSFTASNNSAFSYWEAPFAIILSNNGKITGVNRYVINDFASYDSKEIKITWPGTIGSVSDISIAPDINIMDEGVYRQLNE